MGGDRIGRHGVRCLPRRVKRFAGGSRELPADGFPVLSVVRPCAVDPVNRQIFSHAPAIKRWLWQRRVPREQYPLVSAHCSAVDGPNVVPLRPERRAHKIKKVGFERQDISILAVREPRSVRCHLYIHAEVDEVHDVLGVRLGLNAPAHIAECHDRLPILLDETGDDAVERPLAGPDDVGTLQIERKRAAPIVQNETIGRHGNAAAVDAEHTMNE